MSDADAPQQESAPQPVTLHGCPLVVSFGQQVLFVPRDQYTKVIKALLADGYEMVSDLTAVDYLLVPSRALPAGVAAERFEVVVNLLSLKDRQRLRVRVQVPESDASIPTLFDMYPGTEAMEREVYDMFGIVFTDHPDLSRILMPEDWEGHPLRKDYEVGRIPVQFKGAPN
ncbi:MAG: NADH-quinone oxidoreductase subunit C [Actinomycetes bacterium]|jgi:NADH-quinone oxidoreductase subunit C